MSKIAFIFPGQGAQYKGMGKDLYENFDIAKKVFDEANEILDFDLLEICFNDTEDKINQTEFSQPAILATSIAALEVLRCNGVETDYTAGLSLGEYTSLYYAESFDLKTGIELVRKRGLLMMEACANTKGTMAAIMGLDRDKLSDICSKVSGVCEIANYNCPGQLVISGEIESIKEACELAKEAGAKRTIELSVSGPFHSSLLAEASTNFGNYIENFDLREPNKKVVMNVTGDFYKGNLKEIMSNQIKSSVFFEDSILKLINEGVDTFIEIGPGKVLSGFVKKIDRKLNVLNIEDSVSLALAIEKLKEA